MILESKIDGSLLPIGLQEIEKITNQMKKCVCKISKGNKTGSGFFCKLAFQDTNSTINLLVANNHILGSEDIKIGETTTLSLEEEKDSIDIIIDSSRIVYTSENYDITFVQIFDKDGINNFFEIDEKIYSNEDSLNLIYKELYILNYQDKNKIYISCGNLLQLKNDCIYHFCNTYQGSSGSPILSLSSFFISCNVSES